MIHFLVHVLADFFLIEMLQTTIARVMEKYYVRHGSGLGNDYVSVIFALSGRFKRILRHHSIKKNCRNHLPYKIII